jgi:hypothetical protein
VPYEELVLQARRDYPEAFSLRNHPEHPDASDIHKRLYQTLKPAGLIVSVGSKVFRLTEAGVNRAKELDAPANAAGVATSATRARPGREEQHLLHQCHSVIRNREKLDPAAERRRKCSEGYQQAKWFPFRGWARTRGCGRTCQSEG